MTHTFPYIESSNSKKQPKKQKFKSISATTKENKAKFHDQLRNNTNKRYKEILKYFKQSTSGKITFLYRSI